MPIPVLFTEHGEGCKPLHPCPACQAVAILRQAELRTRIIDKFTIAVDNGGFEATAHKRDCSPIAPCSNCVFIKQLESLDSTLRKRFFCMIEDQPTAAETEAEERRLLRERLQLRVDELDWSVRIEGCLRDNGTVTLAQLCFMTEAELLCVPNFGRNSLNEVKSVLSCMELRLGMDIPEEWRTPQ